jgi:hypothetical protein
VQAGCFIAYMHACSILTNDIIPYIAYMQAQGASLSASTQLCSALSCSRTHRTDAMAQMIGPSGGRTNESTSGLACPSLDHVTCVPMPSVPSSTLEEIV